MLDFIMVPAIMAIIGSCIYGIFELFARRKERLAMIDKMSNFQLESNVSLPAPINYSTLSISKRSFVSLRFGLLFAGLGLGLIVGFIIGGSVDIDMLGIGSRRQLELILGASTLLFGGVFLSLASIIEYVVTNKDDFKDKKV